jgi:DNA-directed RNA polymerase subunit RPC12/RpoP
MDQVGQGWMNPDEDVALVSISVLEPQSYALMEAIFSETRPAVWEAAVKRFDPRRRRKGYRRYVDSLSDQNKVAIIAVKCPDIEMCEYAASHLDDRSMLHDMYEKETDVRYRDRILQLSHDGEFVASEIAKMSPQEQEDFFSRIHEPYIALRIYRLLPDDMQDARALAQQRLIDISDVKELFATLHEDLPLQFKDAIVVRLTEKNSKDRIKPAPEDVTVLCDIAKQEGEGSPAITLLDRTYFCWKCGTKLIKAGTFWDKSVHHAYSDDTTQKWSLLECPNCGYETQEKVLRWL